MALTIDALKGLFKKLGGSDSGFAGVNTIPEAIDKVTSVASSGGGGGSLPEPGNVGNVLTSTGTGWESAEPTDNEYIVHGTINTETFAVTVDATYAQIAAAVAANKNVFLVAKDTEETVAMFGRLEMFLATISSTFYAVLYMPGGYKTFFVIVNANDTVETGTIDTLPLVSESYNGKILGVKNGAYALVDSKAPLIVTGTFETVGVGNNTVTITTPLADIYTAAQAGRAVYLEYTEDGVTTRMGLATYENDNGAYALGFSLSTAMSDKPAVATVAFDNSLVGVFNIDVGQ